MAQQSDTELTAIRHGQRVTGEDYMYTVKDGGWWIRWFVCGFSATNAVLCCTPARLRDLRNSSRESEGL